MVKGSAVVDYVTCGIAASTGCLPYIHRTYTRTLLQYIHVLVMISQNETVLLLEQTPGL